MDCKAGGLLLEGASHVMPRTTELRHDVWDVAWSQRGCGSVRITYSSPSCLQSSSGGGAGATAGASVSLGGDSGDIGASAGASLGGDGDLGGGAGAGAGGVAGSDSGSILGLVTPLLGSSSQVRVTPLLTRTSLSYGV